MIHADSLPLYLDGKLYHDQISNEHKFIPRYIVHDC